MAKICAVCGKKPSLRAQPEPLDGGHEAPVRPKPQRSASSLGRKGHAGVRLHECLKAGKVEKRSNRLGAASAAPTIEDVRALRARQSYINGRCARYWSSSARAEAALERNRARIDDLNVYPVPDGDTGTNMLLTVRSVREALLSR